MSLDCYAKMIASKNSMKTTKESYELFRTNPRSGTPIKTSYVPTV